MSEPEEPRTERTVQDGVLIVSVYHEREFASFDGEGTNTAEVKEQEIRLPADPELAKDLGHTLLGFYTEQGKSTGPPGQKPMHQQYAEVEPSR